MQESITLTINRIKLINKRIRLWQPRQLHPAWDDTSEVSGRSVTYGTEGATGGGGKNVADHRLRADKAYKKWIQRHRIGDSLGSSYDSVHFTKTKKNSMFPVDTDIVLWTGLTILMTGTVVSFVGLGEKGFRSKELRLVGPILSAFGLALCVIRIGLCCFVSSRRSRLKEELSMEEQFARAIRLQHVVSIQAVRFDALSIQIPSIQVDPG